MSEDRRPAYVSRLVQAAPEHGAAALVAIRRGEPRADGTGSRWSLPSGLEVRGDGRTTAPLGVSYWALLRFPGRVRVGRWTTEPVELELTPWSDEAAEVALRYCGRRRPGPRYFRAADAVLDALVAELEARLAADAVEDVAGYLRSVPRRTSSGTEQVLSL